MGFVQVVGAGLGGSASVGGGGEGGPWGMVSRDARLVMASTLYKRAGAKIPARRPISSATSCTGQDPPFLSAPRPAFVSTVSICQAYCCHLLTAPQNPSKTTNFLPLSPQKPPQNRPQHLHQIHQQYQYLTQKRQQMALARVTSPSTKIIDTSMTPSHHPKSTYMP